MLALQEITQWEYPNHIYITSNSKSRLHAFVVDGKLTVFKKALPFSTSYRRFTPVENTWLDDEPVPAVRTWQVVGSRGTIYTVTESEGVRQCSCSGYQFRGRCKHLDMA